MHNICEDFDTSFSVEVGSKDAQASCFLPKRTQGSLRRKDQGNSSSILDSEDISQPKKQRPVTRVAITLRTGAIRNAISHFKVIKKPSSFPTTAWTLESCGQDLIANHDIQASPENSPEQPGCSDKSKICSLAAVPVNDCHVLSKLRRRLLVYRRLVRTSSG